MTTDGWFKLIINKENKKMNTWEVQSNDYEKLIWRMQILKISISSIFIMFENYSYCNYYSSSSSSPIIFDFTQF